MSEQQGPRVTQADIDANIVSEHYFRADEGVCGAAANPFEPSPTTVRFGDLPLAQLSFCVLVLRQIGRRIAREHAVDKAWLLLGYALRDKIAARETPAGASTC